MLRLDKTSKNTLKNIYIQFKSAKEIIVNPPEFQKTIIDYLVDKGLIEKIDLSTLSGWKYIVRPTHYGKITFTELLNNPLSKVESFIIQGEIIKEEYHSTKGSRLIMSDYVSGPKTDQWFNEIYIFNSRTLINHPLHDQIAEVCRNHKKSLSTFSDMMGYLKALASDDEFWNEIEQKEDKEDMRDRKTIAQYLDEDIERCEDYLTNLNDDKIGVQLYVEITARYDSIISGLGNGLYQYYAERNFYDPEISGDSLIHNLTVIKNKLIAYQAEKYPPIATATVVDSNPNNSKKIFIVHGHDNEAKQEMARTLMKGGFQPIILHEQPDSGKTIIEKIERFSDVCYAVVLYTECDKGRDKNKPIDQERNRARQNVVFEHGYLIGKLGRDRVCALVKGDVETPGDISGVIYTPMDPAGGWKIQLANNMMDVGLSVDMNTFCR